MELPDEEKERRPDLEHVGLLRKRMDGTVDASARGQAHYAQILKEHSFVQGLSNPELFRSRRYFMVEMPADEEKWFGRVLFSEYDGK